MVDRQHLIVSCAFGDQFLRVYPAVPGFANLFFANNPMLADHARQQGWTVILMDAFPLAEDILISSLQSKWVKFLQFLDHLTDFAPDLGDVTRITYHDHKFEVRREHIDWILSAIHPDSDLLIRETPRLKTTIADEIGDAMRQERYRRHMPATLAFIEGLEATGQISPQVRIVNTGLIHYRNLDACRAYTQTVYDACMQLDQPECQIIWAALSQMTGLRIQTVPWKQLEPLWKAP